MPANKANFDGYNIDYAETFNKGHGRIEQRRCWVGYEERTYIENETDWKGLNTIVMVESERTKDDETTY